jgi:beta-galactosidase
MKKILFIVVAFLFSVAPTDASKNPGYDFSTAGFYKIDDAGRTVYNFNVGWRFFKGGANGAEQTAFDDSDWEVVNTPHGLEYLPDEASGCVNYQGEAWYRKHFKIPENMREQKIFLNFEAIMGKSSIWVNGKLLKENFGGYLPVIIDITDEVNFNGEGNIIAVWADNSDDPSYPPGKPQSELDFTYFGGIYRDVWLYSTHPVHITDPNYSGQVAGGGVFIHYENLSDQNVDVLVATEVINETDRSIRIAVSSSVLDDDGARLGSARQPVTVPKHKSIVVEQKITLKDPHLWHPDDPYLHRLVSEIIIGDESIDGISTKIGIRKLEFSGKEGFILNNRPFGDKLMGANRHQDFAYIGNAMSNSLHWRDVKKLRNAGMRIIRAAHYPMDPAFMDACDELGMFIIVATPGWQFWNDDPVFEQRVYSDIRNMVRRDRNHASVIMWEPILNETGYPEHFAKNVHDITHEEFPFPGCFTACDERARGSEHFDIRYGFSGENIEEPSFVREWGDHVDDWSSHNSDSRGRRSWGENVQIIQALHYLGPQNESRIHYDLFYSFPAQMVGGALWHSFDHNRGYHPDPFYGGIMDIFRQPKYSYYGFQSMRDPDMNVPNIDNGPFVYIANEMTPFSGNDVWVFTNCEEVRLSFSRGDTTTITVKDMKTNMPHPPLKFEDVYSWSDLSLGRSRNRETARIVAEGLINGKVVANATRMPAKRESQLLLEIDTDGTPLVADGSDIVTVIAKLVDQNGNVKRLGEEQIYFEVTGEGSMIAGDETWANPRKLEWGTAPCLIRSTTEPGEITVRARTLYEGVNIALPTTTTFESVSSPQPLLYTEIATAGSSHKQGRIQNISVEMRNLNDRIRQLESELNKIKLKQVEEQQTKFINQ